MGRLKVVLNCPYINTGSTASVPSFVGNDYFCESGTASNPTCTSPYQLYTEGYGNDEGPC